MNEGNDCQPKKLWLLDQFSSSVPKEIYGWEYGEFGDWCWDVNG